MAQKCINGKCEIGVKVFTSTKKSGTQWICRWRYKWSDGSQSPECQIKVKKLLLITTMANITMPVQIQNRLVN